MGSRTIVGEPMLPLGGTGIVISWRRLPSSESTKEIRNDGVSFAFASSTAFIEPVDAGSDPLD